MKEKHEDYLIESHEEKSWRLFDRESWRMNKLFTIIYLFIFMSWRVELRIQVNTQFQHFNLTWILSSNIMTQLKYSISKFWLESSLDESRIQLNLNDLTQHDQFNHFVNVFKLTWYYYNYVCLLWICSSYVSTLIWR